VDTNAKTSAGFGKNAVGREFASTLIYRLRRKWSLESNADNTSTSDQLLVIWRSDHKYECYVRVLLIKHDNTITLDEDQLKKLDYPPSALLKNSRNVENKWKLDDATVLITSRWEKQIHTIEVTISEGTGEDDSMEPLWISSNM
jgi:hypothetical protein